MRETLFCPSLLFALHRHGHAGRDSDYVNESASLTNGFRQNLHQSARVRSRIPRSACAPGSRGTKQLDTVATRVIPATGSFYSARGIGSQASVGAAVDEERWAGKTKSSIFDSYVLCVDVRCF